MFDAKFHYNLWRPVTAIRNADITGNTATPQEASWLPLIDTPMHPEYPCAHCISSGAAARTMLIAVSFCLGVVTSTLTAWVWWECGGWVADRLGLPSGIVGPGVLLFWLLPAIVIAVLMVTCPPRLFEGSLIERYMKDRLRGIE